MEEQAGWSSLGGRENVENFFQSDPKVASRAAVKEISGCCRVAKFRQMRLVAAYHQGAFLHQTALFFSRVS